MTDPIYPQWLGIFELQRAAPVQKEGCRLKSSRKMKEAARPPSSSFAGLIINFIKNSGRRTDSQVLSISTGSSTSDTVRVEVITPTGPPETLATGPGWGEIS